VCKPYPEYIDERLEDWMTYKCYQKIGKREQADQSLQKIIAFQTKIENTVNNFLPANEILTAWAMEKLATKAEASAWLQQEVKKYPDNKIIKWCWQIFENGRSDIAVANNSGVRIITELEKIK
jgi:tetratricopeptide (TPR) repeat protein